MVKVVELGYLGLNVTDMDAWREFATECVGLEIDEGEYDDRFYLRMDNQHHRITVFQSDEDDMAYMGWRVSSEEDFKAMAEKLSAAGIKYTTGSEEEVRERHVLAVMKLKDPSGIPVEIFWSPQIDVMKPFHPGRPMYGNFLTGSQGLGHALIRSDDFDATFAFYATLGLTGAVQYRIPLPNGAVAQPVFMSCNERQHSVAFGIPGMKKNINHLMLEYTEFHDLGIAHDRIRNKNIDVALQLGMHANDKLYTFYSATPSNWLLELGWGEDFKPHAEEHYVGDIFGHAIEAKGYGMDLEL